MLRGENMFLIKSTKTKIFLTFYVMKVFGSWPYRINSKNFACPEKKIFSVCLVGFLIGHAFLVINLLVVYDNLEFTSTQFKIHKNCLQEICFGPICRNLCAHLVIIWMIDLQNVTSILNLLYHRKLRTLDILNKSVRMAAIFKLELPLASTSVIFFVAVQVCAFIFQWSRAYFAQWYFDEFLLTYLAMSCTLAANNLISLCLLTMEYSHKEITRQLSALSNVAVTRTVLISTRNLQRLLLLHWQVTSIIKHISTCFAFDMLIESVTSAVRVIYFMFLMLKFLTDAFYNPSKSSTFSIFQSIVFLISVVGKFVYLCYRCNRVVQETPMKSSKLLWSSRANKLKHFAPLAPVVYIGFFFGLLPYKWNTKHLSMPGLPSDQDILHHSLIGILISYFYFLIGLYVGFVNVQLTVDLANKYNSCFDDICWGPVCRNVCVHLVIVWVVYIGCISSILGVLYYHRHTTLHCLNQMNQLIAVMQVRIPLLTSFLILLFLTSQVTSFIYQMRRSHLMMIFVLEFGPPYLLICLTLANACVTGLLLKLLEIGHVGLNNQVEHLFQNYNRRIGPNIIQLMSVHWELSDLTDLVSHCVRVDLMFVGVCSTIRVIYFMFSMLRVIEESMMQKPGSKFSTFQSIIFMVTVVGPFVSLCYRCNRVVQEEENSLISINRLLLKARSHKDTQAVSMLSDFLEQAKVRQISFSACGLFTLNLRLVCTIFGITMTYFIVLVQFKTAAQSPKN